MGTGNEWIYLVVGLLVIALIVWGVFVLIRKAVQSGTERANRANEKP